MIYHRYDGEHEPALKADGDYCNLPCGPDCCRWVWLDHYARQRQWAEHYQRHGEITDHETEMGFGCEDVVILPNRRRTKLYMNYCRRSIDYSHPVADRAREIEETTGYEMVGGLSTRGNCVWGWRKHFEFHEWRYPQRYRFDQNGQAYDIHRGDQAHVAQLDEARIEDPIIIESGNSSYRFKRDILKLIGPYLRHHRPPICAICHKRTPRWHEDARFHASCVYQLQWIARIGTPSENALQLIEEAAALRARGHDYFPDAEHNAYHHALWKSQRKGLLPETKDRWLNLAQQAKTPFREAERNHARFQEIEKLLGFLEDENDRQKEKERRIQELENRRWHQNRKVFVRLRRCVQQNNINDLRTLYNEIRSRQTET